MFDQSATIRTCPTKGGQSLRLRSVSRPEPDIDVDSDSTRSSVSTPVSTSDPYCSSLSSEELGVGLSVHQAAGDAGSPRHHESVSKSCGCMRRWRLLFRTADTASILFLPRWSYLRSLLCRRGNAGTHFCTPNSQIHDVRTIQSKHT